MKLVSPILPGKDAQQHLLWVFGDSSRRVLAAAPTCPPPTSIDLLITKPRMCAYSTHNLAPGNGWLVSQSADESIDWESVFKETSEQRSDIAKTDQSSSTACPADLKPTKRICQRALTQSVGLQHRQWGRKLRLINEKTTSENSEGPNEVNLNPAQDSKQIPPSPVLGVWKVVVRAENGESVPRGETRGPDMRQARVNVD